MRSIGQPDVINNLSIRFAHRQADASVWPLPVQDPVGYRLPVTDRDSTDPWTTADCDLARLPHRAPMLLIESILARNEGAVLCRARIPEQYPVASNGQAPPVLSVEIGAQASAVLEPLPTDPSEDEAEDAGSRVGFLVSVRRVAFQCQMLPTETPLLVRAEGAGQAGPLQMVRFELIREADQDEENGTGGAAGDWLRLLDQGLPAERLLAAGTLGTFEREQRVSG